MPSSATLAAIRFGYGLSPHFPAPEAPWVLIDGLWAPDHVAARHPVTPLAQVSDLIIALNDERRAQRKMGSREDTATAKRLRRDLAALYRHNLQTEIARILDGPDTLRERLTAFWADHFTAIGKGGTMRSVVSPYVEEAIRPHVTGRFGDMLRAVATHPVMIAYLDQSISVGPNSASGAKKDKGLNENLAREVLELHTLGVGGPYTQDDVREFAELLTGLRATVRRGMFFQPRWAEPGAETVLGRSYGGDGPARIEDIHAALDDLARHPATAAHLARKLAVHFVSDTPDQGLVDHVAAAYRATQGDLRATTTALLEHPAAWSPELAKAKRPQDYICSALRALGVTADQILSAPGKHLRHGVLTPLRAMGQPYQKPTGPDGWAEGFDDWITPQGLAGRIQWGMAVPQALGLDLPDPRDFVQTALADAASADTRFAAKAAETRWEGVGLILAAPEFNRR